MRPKYIIGEKMSINLIIGNLDAKRVIVNQLKSGKKSGTYLFYGKKGADLMEFALAFAKGLNCNEEEFDYCDSCRVCGNINKGIYSDLHIIRASESSIKIEQIREVIKNASESSYENGKKVFIIEDVNKLRKESANALLKIVEEPPKDTYFILLSNSLSILPTIKSRSLSIEIQKLTAEELNVTEDIYSFFMGDVREIKNFKKFNIPLENQSYRGMKTFIKDYLENGDFQIKIKILAAMENYLSEKDYLDEIEKIAFAEELEKSVGKSRDFLENILYCFILKSKNLKNLEYLLELKESIRYNVNISLILTNFMLNL